MVSMRCRIFKSVCYQHKYDLFSWIFPSLVVIATFVSPAAWGNINAVNQTVTPATVAAGGTTNLVIAITNKAPGNPASISFTDTYPGGFVNATVPVLANSCAGTATGAANGTSLSLSGGSITGNKTCTVSVNVSVPLCITAGNYTFSSVSVSSTTNSFASNTAPLTVTFGAVSATTSTVVASPISVAADGTSTSTVTVTLRDCGNNPVSGKTVTLAAGSGSSVIATVSGTTNASGQATFTVRDSVAETVTYTATDTTDGITINQTASVTFTAVPAVASFNVVEPGANAVSGKIYTKVAGQNFALDIVALTAANAVATSFTGSVGVEVVDKTSGGGACTNMTVIAALTNQTFVSGDAGRHVLSSPNTSANVWPNALVRIKYPTSSPTVIACSGDNFAIRPSAVTLNVSPSMALPPSSTATPTIKAAASFTLTATTSPSVYAGTLTLDTSTSKLTAQTTSQDTSTQNGGTVGTLTPSSLTANATPSNNAAYTEVGYLYLAPGAFRDDGYTSVDQPSGCTATNSCDCVTDTTGDANLSDTISSGKYGCSIGNKTGYSFGRFIPDHFDTVVTGPMACATGLTCAPGSMVYSGQTFTTQVTAYNAATTPAATQNYASAFAKAVTLYAYDKAGGATLNPGSGVLSSNTLLASAFTAGVATTATPVYTFGTVPTAPADIYMRAIETSGVDNVTSLRSPASLSVEGGVTVVSGRVKIINAYGSELLPLSLTASLQYWGGASVGYVNSTTDNLNTVTAAKISRTNCQGSLLSAGVCSPTLGTISSVTSVPAPPPPYGVFSINLSAPGAGNDGSEDLTVNAGGWPTWLPSSTGRATFGVYKGNNLIIYQRESY